MKSDGLLHPELLRVIGSLGHLDEIVVCDAGLPVPPDPVRIDLAYRPGGPPFVDVLETIVGEMALESAVAATEASEELYGSIARAVGNISIERIAHADFKRRTAGARAIVRTGEFTPYANVILVCGVPF